MFLNRLTDLGIIPIHKATLIIIGVITIFCAIAISWLLGNPLISDLFIHLDFLQQNPSFLVGVPTVEHKYYLLIPTIIFFVLAQVVMILSPKQNIWSRVIVVSILLSLLIRYCLWRVFSSLHLANPIDGIFSIILLFLELIFITINIIQLYLILGIKNRVQEADHYSKAVKIGEFYPSIDILIPTYNEPTFILRRSIIGCQSLNYKNKKIYLLDDTNRPEMAQLASELGCYYINRKNNIHAKAGNLNHAISKTNGELILIFDADFIPTKNFLHRTVGFFQNPKIALVQTPQSFYNPDSIATNLGLEEYLTPEEEIFFRQIERIKDGADSVLCAGSSFIVRRSAIESINGFVTESLSEDFFTSVCLSAKGYELVYLDEKLSAGLAAENISDFVNQRLRWEQGMLQGFFIDSNPLTIPGLSWRQRLANFESILYWFTGISRIFFLIVPILYSVWHIIPIQISCGELIYIFLPYYIIQLSAFSWLNMRSRSAILSDIYALILCFPIAITIVKVFINPFHKRFNVTPKGTARDQYYFNWRLALPIIFFLIITMVSFWMNIGPFIYPDNNVNLGLIWSSYNLFILTIALLCLIDVPKPDIYQWFKMKKPVKIISDHQVYEGITNTISEKGAEIELQNALIFSSYITLEFPLENLQVAARIVNGESSKIKVIFESMTLSQERTLIEMLYCYPYQWQKKDSPGEWQSLWLLLQVMIKLFFPISNDHKKLKVKSQKYTI